MGISVSFIFHKYFFARRLLQPFQDITSTFSIFTEFHFIYRVCWQTECKKGFPDEKEGFTDLVKELSVEFRPRGLVLSAAVSPSKQIVDAGYDVPTLSEYFDWIAIMTYDYHGQWDKKTGHVAPLYYHPDDDISYFNAVSL